MNRPSMRSLALAFPKTIRPNEFWQINYPSVVETAASRSLARLWRGQDAQSTFEQTMAEYARDPFKGALERRVLGDGDSAVELEAVAAAEAMAAAGVGVDDIDLVIVSAMRPDSHAVGDAAFLVQRLGLRCPAINLETACASSVAGYDLASALISAGRHRRILVVASCTYSRDIDEGDSLAWFLADGAGAFVVDADRPDAGWLGSKAITTAETCGAFVHELAVVDGEPTLVMSASSNAGKILHDSAEPFLNTCCRGAAEAAGVGLDDIAFFVFNTPTAWYAEFGAKVLGVDRERTISSYPIYTNIGPALMPANLYHAAAQGRIQPGDLVMLYAVGSASTAMSVVMRWGECELGTPPVPSASGHVPH